MIVYDVISSYHLLNAVIDGSKYEKEQLILLLSSEIPKKYSNYRELKKYFSKIIEYDFSYAVYHTDVETKKYFSSLLDIDISKRVNYDKIYCACPHHSFGYYLAINNIPFIFCEDGAGTLSRPEMLFNLTNKIASRLEFNKKCLDLGLYDGSNPNVELIRCNLRAQQKKYDFEKIGKKIEDFDTVKELFGLPNDKCKEIIDFFLNGLSIDTPKNSTLLLTQHFANLRILEFEQQVLVYQTFIDYFFDNKTLTIKPHPDDLMYYSQLFPEAQIIREKFPSEFLPFVLSEQPECVATISSTAIFNLRGHYPKVFELDSRYEQDFEMTHRYYAAVCMAQKLGLNISCVGANDILVQRLCESLGAADITVQKELSGKYEKTMILVDDVTEQGEQGRKDIVTLLHGVPENSCVVFINSKKDFCWYEYTQKNLWKSMVPVVLKKTILEPQSEDFYASVDDEVLYIYSANKELLSMVKEVQIEKALPHVGIQLSNQCLTPEQEKIKVLEGILAATEKRLLYYIEKEQVKK